MSIRDEATQSRDQRYAPTHGLQHHGHTPPKPHNDFMSRRMYAGSKPIALLEDVAHLHDEVVRWLIGEDGSSYGQHGYVPLMEDGTVDSSRVVLTGYDHDLLVAEHVSKINIKGNLLQALRDPESGALVIRGNFPQVFSKYSMVGSTDGVFPGDLALRQSDVQRLIHCTSPSGHELIYGDWVPGQQIAALQRPSDQDSDFVQWSTVYKIAVPDLASTRLELKMLAGNGVQIFTSLSDPITEDTENILDTDPNYISVAVSELQKIGATYACKLTARVNLPAFITQSRRFWITLTQKTADFDESTWTSDSIFYIADYRSPREQVPIAARVDFDQPEPNVQIVSSGRRFVTDGYIRFTVSGLDYINFPVIKEKTVMFQSNAFDGQYQFSSDDIDYGQYSKYDVDAKGLIWSHTFRIRRDLLYPLEPISAKIKFTNGVTQTQYSWDSIQVISNGSRDAFFSTFQRGQTTRSIQDFTGQIYAAPGDDYKMKQYATYQDFAQQSQLQIIPNYGLVWPDIFGQKDIAWQERVFKRVFHGQAGDTSRAFGGSFKIYGLQREALASRDIVVRISPDDGRTWLWLNDQREGQNPFGVKTYDIQTDDGALLVGFALPGFMSFSKELGVRFQLTSKSREDVKITRIQMRDQSGQHLI